MLAVNEWLILVVITAVIALVVWLIVRASRGRGTRSVSEARVRGAADDVLTDLQLATAGLSNTVTRRETPDSFTVEWTYIPGWAFVVALFTFPLGLIALIARTSTVGTVVARQESDDVTLMQIAGIYNKQTARAINKVIGSRS